MRFIAKIMVQNSKKDARSDATKITTVLNLRNWMEKSGVSIGRKYTDSNYIIHPATDLILGPPFIAL